MDALSWFGLFAVSVMLAFYAARDLSPWIVLTFGDACLAASIRSFFLLRAWPRGAAEAALGHAGGAPWRLPVQAGDGVNLVTAEAGRHE